MKRSKIKSFRIVDFIGLAVFFAVISTAIFIFLRKAEYVTVAIRVTPSESLELYSAPLWYLNNIKPGTEQKNMFGRTTISLLKTYSYPSNGGSRIMYLNIKVLSTYNKTEKSYTYQGVPLLIGGFQTFKLNGVLIQGVVHSIKPENEKRETKMYLVEGYINSDATGNQETYVAETASNGIKNYLADKFVKGLAIKDSDGTVITSLEDVTFLPATKRFISNGRWYEVEDNEKKQVKVKVKILTEKFGDVYLYQQNIPIAINSNIFLDFWDFAGVMTITDFKEI